MSFILHRCIQNYSLAHYKDMLQFVFAMTAELSDAARPLARE
jgi:hypothetical protein